VRAAICRRNASGVLSCDSGMRGEMRSSGIPAKVLRFDRCSSGPGDPRRARALTDAAAEGDVGVGDGALSTGVSKVLGVGDGALPGGGLARGPGRCWIRLSGSGGGIRSDQPLVITI
jgi:hypothetical protein